MVKQRKVGFRHSYPACIQHLYSKAPEETGTMETDLKMQEAALVLELKAACNAQGVEVDLGKSSAVFMQLGDVYYERFANKSDLTTGRFAALRSAALYQATLQRSGTNPEQFKEAMKKLHVLYGAILGAIDFKGGHSAVESVVVSAKKMLGKMRKDLQKQFNKIKNPFETDQQVTRQQQAKFHEQMESYQNSVSDLFTKLMKYIFDKCATIAGELPCSFAVLGLGSLARFEVTPFSDFESILVLENQAKVDENTRDYFRNYAMLAHLVVIGLGETILPSMAIDSLNDFLTPGGDWFVDLVTKRGLSFDGLIPHACKNPLGRLPTKNKPWHTELIQTVDNMLRFVDEDIELKEGYHLAEIISQSMYVTGGDKCGQPPGKCVATTFQNLIWNKLSQKTKSASDRMKTIESLREDIRTYNFKNLKHGQAVNVKKDLYRGITILLPRLAMLVGIKRSSSYAILRGLDTINMIDGEYCADLQTAVAIANYARSKTYFDKGAQWEALAGGKSRFAEKKQTNVLDTVSMSALQHLFCVGMEFQASIMTSLKGDDKFEPLVRTSKKLSLGSVLFRFEEYDQAIASFHKQLESLVQSEQSVYFTDVSDINLMLGRCFYSKNQHATACHHFNEAERFCQDDKCFAKGRILLFRALSERKLRGADTVNSLMKRAHDCFIHSNCSLSSDEGAYSAQSFVDTLQELCRESSDLVPELIEVMVIAGDRFLQESKSPYLALQQYESAAYEMEKYYRDDRHVLLNLYVKEAIAVCKGDMCQYNKAVDAWIEVIIRTKQMPVQAMLDISFKRGYKPYESLIKRFPAIKDALFGLKSHEKAIADCCTIAKLIDGLGNDGNRGGLVVRLQGRINDMLGDLYQRDNIHLKAIEHYLLARSLFKKLYQRPNYGRELKLNQCYFRGGFHLAAVQNFRHSYLDECIMKELPINENSVKILLDLLNCYTVTKDGTLFQEIMEAVDLVLTLMAKSNDNFETIAMIFDKLVRITTFNRAQLRTVITVLGRAGFHLRRQPVENHASIVERATALVCRGALGMEEFNSFLFESVVEIMQNCPYLAFNRQTTLQIRNTLNEMSSKISPASKSISEILLFKENRIYLRTALINYYTNVGDVTDALEALEATNASGKSVFFLRISAANSLKHDGKFSEAMFACNLALATVAGITDISHFERNFLLAKAMLSIAQVSVQQHQPEPAARACKQAIAFLESFPNCCEEFQFNQYTTLLFDVAEMSKMMHVTYNFHNHGKVLLSRLGTWSLKNSKITNLLLLLDITRPPFNEMLKERKLLRLFREVSQSTIFRNWIDQKTGDAKTAVQVVSLLLERIFTTPGYVSENVDHIPLVDALQDTSEHDLIPLAKLPSEEQMLVFVRILSRRVPPTKLCDAYLSIAAMYKRASLAQKAEKWYKEALGQIEANEATYHEATNRHIQCLTSLSWCSMKLEKLDDAWSQLIKALELSLKIAGDTTRHLEMTSTCRSATRTKQAWDDAMSYLTDVTNAKPFSSVSKGQSSSLKKRFQVSGETLHSKSFVVLKPSCID